MRRWPRLQLLFFRHVALSFRIRNSCSVCHPSEEEWQLLLLFSLARLPALPFLHAAMDTFNSGKMNVQYQTIETTQNGELEMYDTKYHSPEPVYSTPEPAHGFQRADSREPLRGYSDSSGNGTQEGLLRKLRSRFSSAELVERLGKSKGRPQTLKSWFFFWAGIFMSLLWCAPAIALITLNATNHVIGASAWCPSGYCPGVPVGTNESLADLTGKAEHGTHNFIGALQFVAKALEVWFTYISVTIVYLITSILARSEHGLPIGCEFVFVLL